MRSEAASVATYLDTLPHERRAVVVAVAELVRGSLPAGYREVMAWGMICWEVPLETSGPTYNGKPLMFAGLAAQNRHIALYLCALNCVDGAEERFRSAYAASGKRLDLGKSCLRFRTLDDINAEAVAEAIRQVPPDLLIAASRRAHAEGRRAGR